MCWPQDFVAMVLSFALMLSAVGIEPRPQILKTGTLSTRPSAPFFGEKIYSTNIWFQVFKNVFKQSTHQKEYYKPYSYHSLGKF